MFGHNSILFAVILFLGAEALPAQSAEPDRQSRDLKQDPNVVPRAPADAMATIEMMPGYYLELVAHEPMIEEPSVVAWDGNGRMYVAEMRSYMQDIDGSGKFDRVSRISLLEDTDGDGVMDKHTVFADELLLPRMILTMHEGIIIRETNTLDLWWLKDTDGDGVSDWREKVFEGGNRGGNLEHQPSGLMWALDNRCYVTYTDRRYRWEGDHFEAEKMPFGDGQWGMTQDDEGQVFFSRAGGETPCCSFQSNLQYGRLDLPGQFAPGYVVCWPIDNIPDVQGGPGRIRDDNTLNHFTAGCGQLIFRGDRLPAETYGDYMLAEPVGRLIRRSKVALVDGVTVLQNAYDKTEFMRTKDANFRPVNLYTGPDGTMYVVDMYRGIIQEGNWVRKGSYLRGVVQQYGLDKNIGRGRIYRVRHRDFEPGPKPNMLDETAVELVAHLAHPNGWWRDEAQKLMVLRRDKSVVPGLEMLIRNGSGIARIHALWTLDGLGALAKDLLLASIGDSDPRLQKAAIRIAEGLLKEKGGDAEVLTAVVASATDATAAVARQAALSAAYRKIPGHAELLRTVAKEHPTNKGIERTVNTYFDRIKKAAARAAKLAEERARNAAIAESIVRGQKHYQTLCFACHGLDGKGTPIPGAEGQRLAPTLIGSPRAVGRVERTVRIVLHGMQGPIDGKTYLGVMVPIPTDDAWLADVLTYVRRSWGNKASPIKTADVTRIRKAAGSRDMPWTVEELRQFDPILKDPARWQLTASANAKQLGRLRDGKRNTFWNSGQKQKAKMWIAVEFPYAVAVDAVRLTARKKQQTPGACSVEISADGVTWKVVTQQADQNGPVVSMQFGFQVARHLRVKLTEPREGENWTIADLEIFGTFHPGEKR